MTTPSPQPVLTRILGYRLHLVGLRQAQACAEQALVEGRNLHVVTLNPEMIMQAEKDPELAAILKRAGLVLPDAAGVVWAARRQGHQVKRLPGIEFSENLLRWAAQIGYRVALIGARQETLETAIARLKERHPKLEVVYSHHGFFSGDEEEAIAKACAGQQPKIVLVALGVPRQEKWIAKYQHLFQGAVLVGVGGSLDVWSGQSRRAPEWMRRLNLEWLYRISSEPWRIRRIYRPLPMFVVRVLTSRE